MGGDQILQTARLRAGLTQGQLAERAGRTQAQISLWESGQRALTLETLQELVDACRLDLVIGLANEDRSLHELAADQLTRSPAERLRRLVPIVEARRATRTLEQLEELDHRGVLIGELAAILRGGPKMPKQYLALTAADHEHAQDVLLDAGWVPVSLRNDFAGVHVRERYEPPEDGWDLELIENPAGIPDHRPLAHAAAIMPGLPQVPVAATRDLWRIAGATPWHREDRVRLLELRALLDLEHQTAAASLAA